MFEKTLLDAQKHWRAKPMAAAIFVEIVFITLLIFAPLFFKTDDFKEFILVDQIFLPPKTPPGPKIDSGEEKSSPDPKKKVEPKEEKTPLPAEEKLQAPAEIPKTVDTGENSNGKDESKENMGKGSKNGGNAGPGEGCNSPSCVPGGTGEPESKDKSKKEESPAENKPRVGGNVQQAKLIQKVEPVYPPLARQNRVQGNVILEAIIGTDGATHNIKVISGHTLLRQSAVDAIEQWKYEPATLNGKPIEIETTITVKYVLK